MQSELLHMMVDQLLLGVSAQNGLLGDWEGTDGGFHASMRDDLPPKCNVLKTSPFTDVKPALA
jgi:hypothetical protein